MEHVDRRTGGLENLGARGRERDHVDRRTGGLENQSGHAGPWLLC